MMAMASLVDLFVLKLVAAFFRIRLFILVICFTFHWFNLLLWNRVPFFIFNGILQLGFIFISHIFIRLRSTQLHKIWFLNTRSCNSQLSNALLRSFLFLIESNFLLHLKLWSTSYSLRSCMGSFGAVNLVYCAFGRFKNFSLLLSNILLKILLWPLQAFSNYLLQ